MSRILYVAYPLLPVTEESAGGAEQVLLTLEREMARRGHETTVAACSGSRVAGRLLVTGKPVTELDAYEARENEHNQRILEHLASRARAGLGYGLGYDLVHDQSGSFWRHASMVAAPVLATLHLPRTFYRPELFARLSSNLFFNCVSAAQARTFAGLPGLAGVVQNGIDIERFPFTASKRDYLLWMGRICEEKGADLAIQVAKQSGRPLILAGQVYPFSYHRLYFERQVRPHLEDGSSWLTFVASPTPERKRELLRHACALLVPSRCEETSSLVALEAMACGTPVIALRRGGIPEIVVHGRTGLIVNVDVDVDVNKDTPEQMTAAVEQVSAIDPRACRAHVEQHFSAGRMASQYEQLYRQVMEEEGRGPMTPRTCTCGATDHGGSAGLQPGEHEESKTGFSPGQDCTMQSGGRG